MTLTRTAWLDRDFVLTVVDLPAQSASTVAKDGEGYVALASLCAEVPKAAERLSHTQADLGGTEMQGALQSVFRLGGEETRGHSGADVMLITDGEIWGADSLIAEARGRRRRSGSRRRRRGSSAARRSTYLPASMRSRLGRSRCVWCPWAVARG